MKTYPTKFLQAKEAYAFETFPICSALPPSQANIIIQANISKCISVLDISTDVSKYILVLIYPLVIFFLKHFRLAW